VDFDMMVGSHAIELLHIVIDHGMVMVLYVSAGESFSDWDVQESDLHVLPLQ
jgi:hypothetical protein